MCKTKAEQCYSDILRQVLPVQRLYLPALSQAHELSCFKELLNLDRDLQPAELEHAAGQLRGSLSEWMSSRRDRYASQLPSDGSQSESMKVRLLTDPSIDFWRQFGRLGFTGDLELATSVFRHRDTNTILIGRDACHAWKMQGELEFLERGASATHALLCELQLDPTTTTAAMLEKLDRRFTCANCPTDLEWYHRSWRSCVSLARSRFRNNSPSSGNQVSHFVEISDADHLYPQWRVVSPNEVAMRGETHDDLIWLSPRTETETWLCNHCSDYLAPSSAMFFGRIMRMGNKWEAIWHVQTEYVRFDAAMFIPLRHPPPSTGTMWTIPKLMWTCSRIRCLSSTEVSDLYCRLRDFVGSVLVVKPKLYIYRCSGTCLWSRACHVTRSACSKPGADCLRSPRLAAWL
jgi:hypothetical protein